VNAGTITHEAAVAKANDVDGLGRLMQNDHAPVGANMRTVAAGSIDFGDSFSGKDGK
jgi:hypothetical protein